MYLISIVIFLFIGILIYLLCHFSSVTLPISYFTFSFLLSLFITKIILLSFFQDKKETKKEIIIAVSADYPPFAFIENEKMIGFDIDLLELITKKLSIPFVTKNIPFQTILPGLQLGSFAIAASGVSSSEERKKEVFITEPYLYDNLLVIVSLKKNPQYNLKNLENKIVIVNDGYTAEQYVRNLNITGLTIKKFKTPSEAFLALQSGRGDAFITAKSTINQYLSTEWAKDIFIEEIEGTDERPCLLVSKKEPELFKKINTILEELTENGELAELRKKWNL